ncbi:MAG: amidohydrolase [Candidatus Heimdallarchaeaceae archaeon]|jgi:amidohydrolase
MNSEELQKILIEESISLSQFIIDIRRQIHMYPETKYEEEKTASLIEEELHKIGYQTIRTAGTGVIAVLEGNEEGKSIGLRADTDALDVTEANELPYKSQIHGKMHACGHDAHVAMLLGAAKIIYKYKEHLKGKVKLIFQPAEEGGGGAKKIVEEGHIEDIDEIFGIHVWRELPSGVLGTREGAFLASSDQFIITITGKGGHAASPEQTFDPTAVLADIYNAIQKIVSREINPLENAVISVPVIKGSDAHNVIPTTATMEGTFRTFNTEVRELIIKRIREVVEGYSHAWRCEGKVEFEIDGIFYPPTVNHHQSVENAIKILKPLDKVVEVSKTMGGEDFAFYLLKTKGAFIALGLYNEEKGIIHPHHHPNFNVDEEVLWKGTATYALLGFYSLIF